jgi:1,4-dihydroxy-2-naphthoate octaprenyltransferase
MGKGRSILVFALLFVLAYAAIAAIAIGTGRPALFLAFGSAPIALKAVLTAVKHKDDIPRLIPANAGTIVVYAATGLALGGALLVGG